MTTRRSTRLSRSKETPTDKELHKTGKENDKIVLDANDTDLQKSSRNQKRKQSTSRDGLSPAVKKSAKKSKDGRMIDDFCWNCHESGYDRICSTCPRVYHDDCISEKKGFSEDVCPECQLQSVDGTKYPAGLTADMLNKVLVCLFRKILAKTTLKSLGAVTGSNKRFWKRNDKVTIKPELLKWPQKQYNVCNPIDLEMLIEAVKRGGSYSKTTEFFSDVKWIYHNCCEAFGADSDKTKAAKNIVKAVKSELLDIESCYECYYNYYNEHDYYDEDPFMIVCKKPHQLLWAKLKGYPAWPSKCLKVIDGMAHIQFFGTHDKTSIKADTCYLMSRKNPTSNKIERESYQRAMREVSVYVQNYEKDYGPFRYANTKVKFFPVDDWHWIKKKEPQSLSSKIPDRNTIYEQKYPFISLYRDVHIEIQNEFSDEEAEGTEVTDQTNEGSDIVIASVIEISKENGFEDMNEPQSSQTSYQKESFSECQTVSNNTDNSWPPYSAQLNYVSYGEDGNTSIKCPNLAVLVPRIEYSDFQYPSIRNVTSTDAEIELPTSQPVITSLQFCDESVQTVSNPVRKLESSSVKRSTHPPSNSHDAMQYHPQPSTSQERMQVISHSVNIDDTSGLPSSSNENAASEFSSESHSSESLQQEMANIASLIGINQDLSLVDPEVQKLALEADHFIRQSGQAFLQYSSSFATGPKVVDALLRRLKILDSAFGDEEKKKAELKAKSTKAFNPILAQIINGTKKKAENQLETDFRIEKEELDKELNNIQSMLSFHNEEHARLMSIYEKNHRKKETQTDLLTEAEIKKFEEEMALEKLKFEQKMNDEILEIKARSWCARCQNQATMHCCWNTNYCSEECKLLHLESHQPLCQNSKCRSQTVMIEEISSTGPETSEDNAISSRSSVAPVIEEC